MEITRRQMLGGLAAAAAVTTILPVAGAAVKESGKPNLAIKPLVNGDFYKDGKFDADAAKKAYYAMMERFGYPIPPRLHTDEFWVLDFTIGQFTQIGMAGIFWVNDLKGNYFGHEIFLLPGQMIPEHRHLKTEKAGAKMEGWHVRHGMIYTFGEGESSPGTEKIIPPAHQGDYVKSKNFKAVNPGEVAQLGGAEQWHFMVAGPAGAIVTEYATYHDGDGLRFSHPKAKL